MSQSFAQVRSLIAAKVSALVGFNLVKMPPQYFGRVANTLAHKGFTVDIRSSQDSGERQRRAGTMMQSIVTVSFAYRLRPKICTQQIMMQHLMLRQMLSEHVCHRTMQISKSDMQDPQG